MAKKVTVINAISDSKHTQPQQRLKVCAYARVSTGSRAQAESYATQVEYYTEKIEIIRSGSLQACMQMRESPEPR